jgi:hypothetical protein
MWCRGWGVGDRCPTTEFSSSTPYPHYMDKYEKKRLTGFAIRNLLILKGMELVEQKKLEVKE